LKITVFTLFTLVVFGLNHSYAHVRIGAFTPGCIEYKQAKSFTDLNTQDYTFINDTSITDRFVLHFLAGVLSIDAPESHKTNSGLHAWVFSGQAHLNSRVNGNVALSLYDLTGKQLQSGQMVVKSGKQ
jgi:hypothetical protein